MDGISGINAYSGGLSQLPSIGQTSAAGAAQAAPADTSGAVQPGSSASSLSISSSVQSFMETYGPVQSNNELTGALLLMLMAEYMKSNNDDEKKGILGLLSALLQQSQGAGAGQGSYMYSSSSLSIETSQMSSGSIDLNATGYAAPPLDPTSSPAADGTAGGLNVVV